jgi:hypothetical protein
MATGLVERIEQARTLCRRALETEPVANALACLSRTTVAECEQTDMLREAGRHNKCGVKLEALRTAVLSDGLPAEKFALERALLVRAALSSLDQVSDLPVDESVKHLFCKEFAFYADPSDPEIEKFSMDERVFPAMCGIVTLTRFPAGQHHWVVSGFPRSWFPKIALHRLPELGYYLFRKLGGLAPYFVPHLNNTTFNGRLFTEREYYKSFYRMTAAIEKQPSIRGIMSASWLHSPETHRVSPHLAFLNQPYAEAGGFFIERGPANPEDGFMSGDPERARLYKAGLYKPTFALLFCTRAQALAWKAAHAEIESRLGVR